MHLFAEWLYELCPYWTSTRRLASVDDNIGLGFTPHVMLIQIHLCCVMQPLAKAPSMYKGFSVICMEWSLPSFQPSTLRLLLWL